MPAGLFIVINIAIAIATWFICDYIAKRNDKK